AIAWLRGGPSTLDEPATDLGATPADAPAGSPGWIAAGALIAAAVVCTVRIYAQFSTDIYGTYYAPPAVLLAAVVVWRFAARLGRSRVAATTTLLTITALALSAHAFIGLYADYSVPVHTPAGTFKAQTDVATQDQEVIDLLRSKVRPGDRLLALPQEPGWLFLLNARPALYDSTFLPGVLGDAADDRRAADALLHGGSYAAKTSTPYTPPRFVIEGTWNFQPWGFHAEGVDVNVALHRAIVSRYRVIGRFGDTATIPPDNSIATAFTVYELR
ncbi:MAG: hypothetical protein REI11_05025, partial [Patulibacter sp.]|nr:hypothetical protein [Patulibacter sp.]